MPPRETDNIYQLKMLTMSHIGWQTGKGQIGFRDLRKNYY